MEIQQAPVVPEDPTIVSGGPLDPSSPEGQAPDGPNGDGQLPPAAAPQVPQGPVYQGLTGDIKTTEELKTYTKNLEDLFVQARAGQALQTPVVQPPMPQAPAGPSAKDRFSELIFSKPEEAYEIAVSESKRQMRAEMEAERQAEENKKRFWANFYEKNQDLKSFQDVVQSIVKAKGAEISQIRTEGECADFLSKESRKLVDSVKKQLGVTETVVPSQPVASLGGNRELPARPTPQPQAPLNFAEQIKKLRPKVMGKK